MLSDLATAAAAFLLRLFALNLLLVLLPPHEVEDRARGMGRVVLASVFHEFAVSEVADEDSVNSSAVDCHEQGSYEVGEQEVHLGGTYDHGEHWGVDVVVEVGCAGQHDVPEIGGEQADYPFPEEHEHVSDTTKRDKRPCIAEQ